jgi:hypothetical protein
MSRTDSITSDQGPFVRETKKLTDANFTVATDFVGC